MAKTIICAQLLLYVTYENRKVSNIFLQNCSFWFVLTSYPFIFSAVRSFSDNQQPSFCLKLGRAIHVSKIEKTIRTAIDAWSFISAILRTYKSWERENSRRLNLSKGRLARDVCNHTRTSFPPHESSKIFGPPFKYTRGIELFMTSIGLPPRRDGSCENRYVPLRK